MCCLHFLFSCDARYINRPFTVITFLHDVSNFSITIVSSLQAVVKMEVVIILDVLSSHKFAKS